MKKGYRNFLIAITVIPLIAIVVATCWVVTHMNPQPQPTKNEYEILKEYCIQLASGTVTKEELEEKEIELKKISKAIDGNSFRIEIANKRCQVAAVFLLSEARIEVENGTVCQKNDIEWNNIMYLQKSLIMTKANVILNSVAAYIVWLVLVLVIFVAIPKQHKECLKKEAEKKFKK